MFNKRDWNGEIYDEGSYFQGRIADETLKTYKFHEKAKILDIGCGSGKTSRRLLESAPNGHVTAIDKSLSMIGYASRTYGHEGIEFVHKDILELDSSNEYTDIVSFCCLHWIENQEKVLSIINKALTEGGSILLVSPTNNNDFIHHLIEKVANSEKWKSKTLQQKDFSIKIFSFTDEEYRKYLENTGLVSSQVETTTIKTSFSDMQLLRNFVIALPLFKNSVSEIDMNDFAKDVETEFKSHRQPDENGNYIFESSVQIIKASKQPQPEFSLSVRARYFAGLRQLLDQVNAHRRALLVAVG